MKSSNLKGSYWLIYPSSVNVTTLRTANDMSLLRAALFRFSSLIKETLRDIEFDSKDQFPVSVPAPKVS